MLRDDIALWRHLSRTAAPVTVIGTGEAPAWLRSLPGFAGSIDSTVAAFSRVNLVGTVVVLDAADAGRSDLLKLLCQSAAEVFLREGSCGWRRHDAIPPEPANRVVDWLARSLPPLAGPFGVLRLKPVRHDGGACWWAALTTLRVPPADSGRRIVLFEDGEPLPVADCIHEDIRQLGAGRYSVWHRGVYFSATDNSDPRMNGRTYEARTVSSGRGGTLFTVAGTEEGFTRRFEEFAAERSAKPRVGRRVMLLISSLAPGGAERQFCNLAKGLTARGCEVSLASLGGLQGSAGHYLPLLESVPVRLLDLTMPSPDFDPALLAARTPGAMELLESLPELFGGAAWNVATHVAAVNPDVLHCGLDMPNLLGAVAGVATGVPRVVLSMRNVNPTHFPYLDVPWFRRWYAIAANVPGVMLSANSHAGAVDYAEWLDVSPSRVRVVHNGLDTGAVRVPSSIEVAALRAELGIPASAPVVAGVFRLSAEKRPLLWLDVIAALRGRFPDLVALHLGQGPMAEEVRVASRERDLVSCVRWLGSRYDPATVMGAADLLLLVSTFEGIPNVALEAQWLQRPVVCTAAGGSVEAVRDRESGYVVSDAAPESLADACARVLADHDQRDRMGAAGERFVRAEFSLERMIDGSLALYTEVSP